MKVKKSVSKEKHILASENKKSTAKVLHDTVRGARRMGPACQSIACLKYQTRSCSTIEEGQRQLLFRDFWSLNSWGEKRMFINSLVEVVHPKEHKVPNSRREKIYVYHLKAEDKKVPVCRSMFLSTFGLKWSTVKRWLADYSAIGTPKYSNETEDQMDTQEPSTSEVLSKKSTKPKKMEFLKGFFDILPKVPSHYCRQSSSKEYLQTDLKSVSQLYWLYRERCQAVASDFTPLSRFTFDRVLKSKNITFFQPRKDMCDKCSLFAVKNLSQEAMDHHLMMKNLARKQKDVDKAAALVGDCYTLCIDVQAVKLVPRIQASVCYYKMKLAVHNFTVYDVANHDALCYWFTEAEGNLTASTFASCLTDYLQKLFRTSGKKPVIVFSDGCPYQNRNSVMSNALLHLAVIEGVPITQKYLEKGHTQMECDSVHAKIETTLGNRDVYLPSQLATITQSSRQCPSPYRTKILSFDFFHNYSKEENMIYPSIRPVKNPNEPQVINIRSLHYDPAGEIMYKLTHSEDEEWKPLPRRSKQSSIKQMKEFPKLLTEKIKLKKDKYDDLQDLAKFIPEESRPYYFELPHEDESIRKAKRKKAQQGAAQKKKKHSSA